MKTEQRDRSRVPRRILSIAGIVLSAAVLPILVINLIFLVKSFTVSADEPASLLGLTPMVVVTDSMNPVIRAGDMIVDRKTDPCEVKVGDIISFFDPTRDKKDVVMTHRVVEIREDESGNLSFITKGDANNVKDPVEIPADRLVGVYRLKIPYLGNVVLFMRTTAGILFTVVLPLILFVAYELIRRNIWQKKKEQENAALKAELELYRAKNP